MAPTGIATFAKTNLCFDLDEMAVDIAIIGGPGDLTGTFNNIEAATRKIAGRKAFPIIFGGDHSITYPVIKGLDSIGEFDIIHIDAHLD